MILRLATLEDLPGLLRLYRFLNPDDPIIDAQKEAVRQHWRHIVKDPRLRYYVVELPSASLVSTCTLTLIPNLTRGLRPYGVIENVVTDPAHRGQGLATRLLRHALDDAWREGCYKVILSTGSKRESTLRFYENAGFQRGVKTGFVAYPDSRSPATLHHP
jgi:GNAT superfamily N-acetyltransferase